jgi:uncharacterized membrane protein YhaH (DUF805 family)
VSDRWYYADQGQQLGPVDIEQLKAALLKIPDAQDVFVWRQGFADWKRAGDVPELAPVAAAGAVPPIPLAERPAPVASTASAPRSRLHLWFGFSGRINRAKYWRATTTNGTIMVLTIAAGIALSSAYAWVWVACAPVILAIIVSYFAVWTKRLHDRNKSAWWLLLYGLLPIVLGAVAGLASGGGYRGVAMPFDVLNVIIAIAAIVDLGCLKGTVGDNRFGPDPLA